MATKDKSPLGKRDGEGLVVPSAALAAVVGPGPASRNDVIRRVWEYIKHHHRQDAVLKTMINADPNLMQFFGRDQVSMFELADLVNSHLSKAEQVGDADIDKHAAVDSSAVKTPAYAFEVGESYTRKDIFRIIGMAEPSGGPWFTGYASHGPDWFIFAGVGTAGRTGHQYDNRFEGETMRWYAKGPSKLRQASIQWLLRPVGRVYLFYRESERDPFTFAGLALPVEALDTTPVTVVWRFVAPSGGPLPTTLAEEVEDTESSTVPEGAKKTIQVNVYERDPNARRKCIAQWGLSCVVCSFNFADEFGDLGAGFIHVHHLRPLAEIGEQYDLDPVADLRPVCPNCHAMLHRQRPAMSIEDLKAARTAQVR